MWAWLSGIWCWIISSTQTQSLSVISIMLLLVWVNFSAVDAPVAWTKALTLFAWFKILMWIELNLTSVPHYTFFHLPQPARLLAFYSSSEKDCHFFLGTHASLPLDGHLAAIRVASNILIVKKWEWWDTSLMNITGVRFKLMLCIDYRRRWYFMLIGWLSDKRLWWCIFVWSH